MNHMCPNCSSLDGKFGESFLTFTCPNCHCRLTLCEFVAKALSNQLIFDEKDWSFRKPKDPKPSGRMSYNFQSPGLNLTSFDIRSSRLIFELLQKNNVPCYISQAEVEVLGSSCPICGLPVGVRRDSHEAGCLDSRHFTFASIETMVACLLKCQYPHLSVLVKDSKILITETVDHIKTIPNPNKGLLGPKTIKKTFTEEYDYEVVVKSADDDHVIWIPESFTNRGYKFVFMMNSSHVKNLRAVEVNS